MNNPFCVVVRSLGGGARPLASALVKRSGAKAAVAPCLRLVRGSCAPVASASACHPFSVETWR